MRPLAFLCLAALAGCVAPAPLGPMPRLEVHGHRGARARFPENTLPAFRYALDAGADVLELDLVVTRDGVLVAGHDPRLNPDICRGPGGESPRPSVRSLTFAELSRHDCGSRRAPGFPRQEPVPGERMPAFRDVLELVRASPRPVGLNVEAKTDPAGILTPPPADFAALVVEELRRTGLVARATLQSFDLETLAAARRLEPGLRLAVLSDDSSADLVEKARSVGATTVSPARRLVTRRAMAAWKAAGLRVVPWTVNREEDWERLAALGVDGIITDDPAALVAWRERRR